MTQQSLFDGADLGPVAVPDAASNEWFTPRWILAWLPSIWLDPCWSASSNVRAAAVLDVRAGDDGLLKDWCECGGDGEIVWVNPPYSDCSSWVEKCAAASERLLTPVVALVPAYSGDAYWHRAVWGRAKFVAYFSRRLKFDVAAGVPAPSCASFTSALIVWGKSQEQAQRVAQSIADKAGDRLWWVSASVPALQARSAQQVLPASHGPVWACRSGGAHPGLGRAVCVDCGEPIAWASWFARKCKAVAHAT